MHKTPLQQAKERFGITEADPTEARTQAKQKLTAAVREFAKSGLWVERLNGDKGLERVSNQKLLHLLDVLTDAKDKFGSRDALIDEVLKRRNRDKDTGLRTKLEQYPTPRLMDALRG